jgi:uncharacterized protein YndB with AHSA1/START domain
MKWLLIGLPIVVAIIAAVLTVVVIGALMPRTHTATRSARFALSPEALWAIVSDFEGRGGWVPGVKGVERLPDRNGHPVWKDVRGDGWGMPMEVEVFEPPRRMVTRIADEKLPFGGRWTWEVSVDGAGSRLRITEDGEIKVAPFRYFAALGDMSSTMRGVLTALGKKTGQGVAIEP